MRNNVRIITSAYFPVPFILLGMLVLAYAGIVLSERHGLISLLLIPIGTFVFAAHYRLTINLVTQTYHDYLWIVGIKRGAKEAFSSVGGMYITESTYRQTFSTRANSMTKRGVEYNGYIRFDEQGVHIISSTDKQEVMRKLTRIQKALQSDTISSIGLSIDSRIADHTKES